MPVVAAATKGTEASKEWLAYLVGLDNLLTRDLGRVPVDAILARAPGTVGAHWHRDLLLWHRRSLIRRVASTQSQSFAGRAGGRVRRNSYSSYNTCTTLVRVVDGP